MANLEASRAHPLAGEYSQKLRDAFFVCDADDRDAIRPVLSELGYRTFELAVMDRPNWVWQRVRRRVPPPEELYVRVKKVLDAYRDCKDPKGRPLLTLTAQKNEPEVLELIRRGFLSDPLDAALYVEESVDQHGLTVYRCLRGTNAVEGLHSQLIKRLTPFNASPELIDAYLALSRHQHNCEVCHSLA